MQSFSTQDVPLAMFVQCRLRHGAQVTLACVDTERRRYRYSLRCRNRTLLFTYRTYTGDEFELEIDLERQRGRLIAPEAEDAREAARVVDVLVRKLALSGLLQFGLHR
jgi:hypothetical protein